MGSMHIDDLVFITMSRSWGEGQVAEHQPGKCEALSSNPSNIKKDHNNVKEVGKMTLNLNSEVSRN
jgi:hypothetical protein